MATYFTLTERRNTCPACHAENILIGSDLIDGMDLCCSQCGSFIGRWSDAREHHFHKEPVMNPWDGRIASNIKGPSETEP